MTGALIPGGFDTAEYHRRTRALQAGMDAADLAGLLLTTDADLRYVAGFLTRFWESPARPWFLLVPASGDPVAVIPSIGVPLMQQSWLSDIRSWASPDLSDDGVSLLAEAIREHVPPGARIGIPMGHETHVRMPLADIHRLQAAIAPIAFSDATDVIRRVREIKSEAEINRIRDTCAVADRAFARVPEFASPGRALDAVFRDFQIALLQEGADWVPYLAGGAGPGGYADVISPATTRRLQRGDILMLDTGAIRAGYFCDFDRNYAIGRPDDATARAHDVLYRATDAGLAAVRPGATAADIFRVMADALAGDGQISAGGRMGHGLGLQLTEWPSLIPDDTTPLRAGMILTLEPGVQIAPGRILVHEENLVVRAGGAELLSARAPSTLPVLE